MKHYSQSGQRGRWTARTIVFCTVLIAAGAMAAMPASAAGFPTSTSLEGLPNPSPACGAVTIKATVSGALFPASPYGIVELLDNGAPLGTVILTPDFDPDPIFGTHVIPTRHQSGKITVRLSQGEHLITGSYVGTDVPSSGSYVQHVTAATSSTSVSSSVDPSVFGQPVSFDVFVSSSCAGAVAGSVQLQADGVDLGAPLTIDAGGHASLIESHLSVGAHQITATFTSSNANVLGSSGSLGGAAVFLAGLQVVTPANTSTSVSSTPNPSEFGAPVTVDATTTADSPSLATADGSIQFQDNGTNIGAPQPLDANGHASISRTDLSVGTHTITAVFTSSSSNFHDSTGSTNQTVTKARTVLTYDGAAGADFNDPVIVSARLTRAATSVPLGGKMVTLTMGSESCSQVTDANGEAACSITPAEPAGLFGVSATFDGDGNYLASADAKPFMVTREETTTSYTGPTVIAQGTPVTLSGRLLEDGITAIAGRTLTLTLGSGAGSQSCTTAATDASGSAQCTVTNVTVSQGPNAVKASFAGDGYYLPSVDASKSVIVFAFPSRGIFVLGDQTVAGRSPLTFWGSQWTTQNDFSGGIAPSAFKGFADNPSSKPPACGGTWTSSPGNSSSPVDALPAYMGTAVSTSVGKDGSALSGNIVKIVVVMTAPGYASNPGHAGTGTIIATYC